MIGEATYAAGNFTAASGAIVEIERSAEAQAEFWLVWNPRGGAPTFPHTSEPSAIAEAERLARNKPGHQFFVLEPKHARFVDDMHRVKLTQAKTATDADKAFF